MILFILSSAINATEDKLLWPPPPDVARVEYIDEIICKDLSEGKGFFSKIKSLVTGKSEKDAISLPYDVLVKNDKMYLTCQGNSSLIEIDLMNKTFKRIQSKIAPLSFPVCLSDGGNDILFITDSENQAVYKFEDGEIELFISSGLTRPTGITTLPDKQRIYIIDTGEHSMKIFNYNGKFIKEIKSNIADDYKFHFPTFVTSTHDGFIIVNDALNYKIKRFDSNGIFISSFGAEGDSPGTFSRPKGIATDSEGNIYVMDNMFDNMQILDKNGRALLVIGTAGQLKGQFWSPSGIAISNDTVYIADTFNNRIQILHFLGSSYEN